MTSEVSWSCLDTSGRCPDDICKELGVWSVARGFKEGLEPVQPGALN